MATQQGKSIETGIGGASSDISLEKRNQIKPTAKFLLPLNRRETHIVIIGGSDLMQAYAGHLRADLTLHHKGFQPVILTAGDANDAIQIALAHSPYAVSTFITTSKTETGRLQDILNGQGRINPVGYVFNPIAEQKADFSEATFNNVTEALMNVSKQLRQNRQSTERSEQTLDALVFELEQRFTKHVTDVRTQKKHVATVVFKVGGSMADLTTYESAQGGYEIYAEMIKTVAKMIPSYNFVFTVGGGPIGDTVRGTDARIDFQRVVRANFRQQAENLARKIKEYLSTIRDQPGMREYDVNIIDGTNARVALPAYRSIIQQRTRTPYDVIVTSAPQGLLCDRTVPPKFSDLLTVLVANYLGIPNIIFVKDTDGIYRFDPHFSDAQATQEVPSQFRDYVGQNPQIKRIYASDVLGGEILRTGAKGGNQHLIEDDALLELLRSDRIGSIQVVNGRSPEDIVRAIRGEPVGSFILNDAYVSPR